MDIVRCAGRQEDRGPGQVLRSSPPAGRNALQNLAAARRVGAQRRLSVAMYPGAMAFTLTPLDAHSLASDLVICATPPLAAAYAGTVMPPWNDSSEATLIIFPPPCASMWRPANWQNRNTAVRLISMTSAQSFSENSAAGARRMIPACAGRC